MTIEKVNRVLTASYCAALAAAFAAVVVYETDTLCPGLLLDGDAAGQLQFVLVSVMELLTIAFIPLALRLFKMLGGRVCGAGPLLLYGTLRLAMLVVPLWFNTILYYMFLNATFGYMAIITVIAMVFVFPTRSRCMSEANGV